MIKIIGLGNVQRRDDGIGPAALKALGGRLPRDVLVAECWGEATELLLQWEGMDSVILIDAAWAEDAERVGELLYHRVGEGAPLAPEVGGISSHALGVAATIALGDVLQLRPRNLVIYAVVGGDFGYGEGLSEAVAAALPRLVEGVVAEIGQLTQD
ncbi:MAG: hydrogenase maturation protease [Candidatus Competibacterales bacterium]